jgi:hypothetical protein
MHYNVCMNARTHKQHSKKEFSNSVLPKNVLICQNFEINFFMITVYSNPYYVYEKVK